MSHKNFRFPTPDDLPESYNSKDLCFDMTMGNWSETKSVRLRIGISIVNYNNPQEECSNA